MIFASIVHPPIINNHPQVFRGLYREVLGYDGAYRVGFDGGVWTRIRKIGWNAYIIGTESDWRLLCQSIDTAGYPQVTLSRDGKTKTFRVYKLVAEGFIGPRPFGMEVCHEDGDKLNTHLYNLRYDTRENNIDDRVKHGTDSSGERHGMSFLTWGAVDKMRAEYTAGGVTMKLLAARYNISDATVCRIVNNKIWIRP